SSAARNRHNFGRCPAAAAALCLQNAAAAQTPQSMGSGIVALADPSPVRAPPPPAKQQSKKKSNGGRVELRTLHCRGVGPSRALSIEGAAPMKWMPDRVEYFEHEPPQPKGEAGWTALVLAGERPGGDPMAAALHIPLKA